MIRYVFFLPLAVQFMLLADTAAFHANYQLARLYYQAEKYENAILKYEYLLGQYPNNSALIRNLATATYTPWRYTCRLFLLSAGL
ncbi:MAG: hypothetical protein LBS05_05355 [Tannerellaceae bacterium]|jgi:outer membrane protein assembly factor BamD (BamD/ComL family)|nr:hypothetical protein [Tannerellaceae bacterium]